ncbi:MAG TPA: hypothetical protein VNO70_11810, partial [Blastocatellia bacterium]|nr:hypothetical protein [Blastocatellia bacterium]
RFGDKFTRTTGIVVQIRAASDIHLPGQLSGEIFQMIVEGLSNIRRHTQSERAFVGIECSKRLLRLRIENDGVPGLTPAVFTPDSIAERAEALGGQTRVEIFGDLGTSVVVEIPL